MNAGRVRVRSLSWTCFVRPVFPLVEWVGSEADEDRRTTAEPLHNKKFSVWEGNGMRESWAC